jgi:hypothetical protein
MESQSTISETYDPTKSQTKGEFEIIKSEEFTEPSQLNAPKSTGDVKDNQQTDEIIIQDNIENINIMQSNVNNNDNQETNTSGTLLNTSEVIYNAGQNIGFAVNNDKNISSKTKRTIKEDLAAISVSALHIATIGKYIGNVNSNLSTILGLFIVVVTVIMAIGVFFVPVISITFFAVCMLLAIIRHKRDWYLGPLAFINITW